MITVPVQPSNCGRIRLSFFGRGIPMDTAKIIDQLTHADGLPEHGLADPMSDRHPERMSVTYQAQ
jgi:hypothetical protein